jgi:hypothetical protein
MSEGMDAERVEARLRAYRPAAPSPELREKVLGRVQLPVVAARGRRADSRGLWWQLATAAVFLVTALLLHSATERIDRRIAVAPVPARDAEQQALDELTHELGGDANARLMAQVILLRDRQEAHVPPAPEVPQ